MTITTNDGDQMNIPDARPGAKAPGRSDDRAGQRADAHTVFEISQFYFQEAACLDDGRFTDWLDLLADDLEYWMPTRTNRLRRQQSLSIEPRGGTSYFDETKQSLEWRIRRFDSGMAWAEDPPSRVRHFVTNVRVRPGERDGDLDVRSNVLIYRTRQDQTTPQLLAGERHDLLRDEGEGLRLLKRSTVLDLTVIGTHNLSIFF